MNYLHVLRNSKVMDYGNEALHCGFSGDHKMKPLKGDKVSMLTHAYPYKPLLGRLKMIIINMQSPGWQPTLCVAWCLIWWFASLEKVWSYMAPNVRTEPGVIKQHKPNQNIEWSLFNVVVQVTFMHSIQ